MEKVINEFLKTLPPHVITYLTNTAQRLNIPRDDLLIEYMDLFNSPFVQQDQQFATLEEKHVYCMQVIHARYIARPKLKSYNLIPFGFESVRKTKSSGVLQSILYVAIPTKTGELEKRRVILRGSVALLYRKVSLWQGYRNVKLGSFANSNDLIADNRTRFENPVKPKLSIQQIIEKLNIKRIYLSQARDFPSTRGSDGYIDRLDLRIIRGIIVEPPRIFIRKSDGTQGANYRITDMSVNLDVHLTDKGEVLNPIMTVWIPPEFAVYDVESECDFIGTVSINPKGEPVMNAISVLPIHAKNLTVQPSVTEILPSEEELE